MNDKFLHRLSLGLGILSTILFSTFLILQIRDRNAKRKAEAGA
jgi:hypothetical protein